MDPQREANQAQWADWVAREVGGDPARQSRALQAALQALEGGLGAGAAAEAAKAAAGASGAAVAAVSAPSPTAVPAAGSCRICGRLPAVKTTVHQHSGFIVVWQHRRWRGPFCRDCGLALQRNASNSTALRGWLGVVSMVLTPITLLLNLNAWLKLRGLAAPDPSGQVARHLAPGASLWRRPGIYVYLALLAVLFVILTVGASTPTR